MSATWIHDTVLSVSTTCPLSIVVPTLMSTSEGRKNQPVNRELLLATQLSLHHNETVPSTQPCGTPYSFHTREQNPEILKTKKNKKKTINTFYLKISQNLTAQELFLIFKQMFLSALR